MSDLDLNAKRAARRAARGGQPRRLVIGDEVFELVEDVPMEIVTSLKSMDVPATLSLFLADPAKDLDRLMAQHLSMADLDDIASYYGATVGESSRPTTSSETTTAP